MKEVCFAFALLLFLLTQKETVKSQHSGKYRTRTNLQTGEEEESSSVQKTPTLPLSKPVVCYERDREDVRTRVISWLKLQDESHSDDGYSAVLRRYFDKLDKNNDAKLDAIEFMELIRTNSTDEEAKRAKEDEYISPILRGLCVDALIAATDKDKDWKLAYHEFSTCLDPGFKIPKKGCELEGKMFEDGAEFNMDCNSCVCACGHWVCTVLKCEDDEVKGKSNHNSSADSEFVIEGEKAERQLIKEIEKEHPHRNPKLKIRERQEG